MLCGQGRVCRPARADGGQESRRLIAVDGVARNEDAAGSTASINGKTLAYNDTNRMSAMKEGAAVLERHGSTTAANACCASRQVAIRRSLSMTKLGSGSATVRRPGKCSSKPSGWTTTRWVVLIQTPTAGVPELAYIQPDHLGTPSVVIDPVRDVAIWEWSNKSEVFGDRAPANDPDGDGVVFDLALCQLCSGLVSFFSEDLHPGVEG
ncbi:hypothetical protein D3C71_1071010 [compost metagenome]